MTTAHRSAARLLLPLGITLLAAGGFALVNTAGGKLEQGVETGAAPPPQTNPAGASLSLYHDPNASPEQANASGGRIVPLFVLPAQEEPLVTDVWLIR